MGEGLFLFLLFFLNHNILGFWVWAKKTMDCKDNQWKKNTFDRDFKISREHLKETKGLAQVGT